MNVSELVELIAKESAIPEKRVALYARRLREDGLLPQSKGRFYPEVSSEHCARLLVALLAAENPQHAASKVDDYERLVSVVTDYLTNDDKYWLRKITVERHTGAASYVTGKGYEANQEQRLLPESLWQVFDVYKEDYDPTTGTGMDEIREVSRQLGMGRFRMVAEFDEFFLGQIYSAFNDQRLEAR